MKILIKDIEEIYTNQDRRVIKNGYIIIEGNIIKEIGSDYEYKKETYFDKIIDAGGKIAIPGLINTHTHAAMTLLRGYADDLPLQTWLEEKIWPYEAELSEDDIYWGTKLAILEMIKNGITTFTDMYFQMDKVAQAVNQTGIRAVLTQGLIEANDGMEGLEASLQFCLKWNDQADGRISTMLAPHAPYTCSSNYLKEIIKYSSKFNLPINIHVAETKLEYEESLKTHGLSPVKYLDKIGLFNQPVLAAHCVYVDEDDIQILARKNVGVAYNPKSNMKLGSGVAPIKKMLEAGINVGIGTDGAASNNNLDLIEEVKIGSYLQKVSNLDPTALNTWEMLDMLTYYGARSIKINKLGKLEENYLADLILININSSPSQYPHHNNLSNLLYAGNGKDISDVIINGQIVMENRNLLTIDEEEVYHNVEQIINSKN